MFFSVLLSISLLGNFHTPNQDPFSIDQAGDWVKSVEPAQEGHQYLLFDQQIHLEKEEIYTHTVRRVLENVEDAAHIEIEFDPAYETLTLHRLVVCRDGKMMDARYSAQVLQRELDLEAHIYTGLKSVSFLLEDLRKGDLVELAYTRKGFNPVFEKAFSDTRRLYFGNQVEKWHYRVVRDKKTPLYVKLHNAPLAMEEGIWDDAQLESYVTFHPGVEKEFEDVPYWHEPWGVLQVSNFSAWQDVSAWGEKLFRIRDKQCPEVQNLVKEWVGKGLDKEQLVLAALHFVQEEIRYLGRENSIFAYQPHSPNETLARRYGDCKDKTLLLKLFLDAMGIESTPCFVSYYYCDTIGQLHPSTDLFDHALLRVCLDGKDYWLDPTRKYQGGALTDHSQTQYGCYLLLNGQENCFFKNSTHRNDQKIYLTTHFQVNQELCELHFQILYEGEEANYFRAKLAHQGKEVIAANFKQYFEALFGAVESKSDFLVIDNRENNQITLTATYTLPELLEEDEFQFQPVLLSAYLPSKVSLKRMEPLALDYPMLICETIRISSDQFQTCDGQKKSFKHPGFTFNTNFYKENDDLVFNYIYQTHADHILSEDFKSLRESLSEINKQLVHAYEYDTSDYFKYYAMVIIALSICSAGFTLYKTRL